MHQIPFITRIYQRQTILLSNSCLNPRTSNLSYFLLVTTRKTNNYRYKKDPQLNFSKKDRNMEFDTEDNLLSLFCFFQNVLLLCLEGHISASIQLLTVQRNHCIPKVIHTPGKLGRQYGNQAIRWYFLFLYKLGLFLSNNAGLF